MALRAYDVCIGESRGARTTSASDGGKQRRSAGQQNDGVGFAAHKET